jgi:hypothetical protein
MSALTMSSQLSYPIFTVSCPENSLLYRQERGDELHNLVTIVMYEKHLNLHQSLQWIGELHDQILYSFLSTIKRLPHWNNDVAGRNVARYVDALASAVRGNDCWSFEVEVLLLYYRLCN